MDIVNAHKGGDFMPNQDGTGPTGQGPVTGRGLGRCKPTQGGGPVKPCGRGKGLKPCGRGQGQGQGRGRRQGRP